VEVKRVSGSSCFAERVKNNPRVFFEKENPVFGFRKNRHIEKAEKYKAVKFKNVKLLSVENTNLHRFKIRQRKNRCCCFARFIR
jgi:hypothetical protein